MRASVRRWFGVLLMVAGGLSHADTYEYDEVGNLKTLSSPRGTRTYTYDEVDRLDTEAGFTGSRNHAYDVNGNRTTDAASAPGTPTTATYTSNTNRIVTINGAAVSLDAAGQITNDGLNSYTWDDAGRLKTVSRAGQLRATYHYDHKHRRTRKVSTAAAPQGAKTIVYHYDDRDRLMAETSDTGVPIRSYAWADENLISQVEYAPNATSTGYDIARILYFELDQLGTPRQARERVGTIVWRWESNGYGTSAANDDPDGNGQPTTVNLRFPGQYFDEESGLHYNWHRYYVPRLGRYLSSDPIGIEGGWNTFSYVDGNPLGDTDIRGLAGSGRPTDLGAGTSIRIDKPHVPGQQEHAHIKTPKGDVVINKDGTQSHKGRGSPGNMTQRVKDFLRGKGFNIPGLPPILDPCFLDPYQSFCPGSPLYCPDA
ncbi:RHS repeat-associated core domain-containing protein [Methyloversatilis sp.]|uniref:RHS repeat-associated core domain-containing protein n=1 Tax=Methyloversatilis sp. TaxID=2569862 RepID=UPI002734B05B|nr:RHS repeat-associated core domain-containing protein [Methyloversatilis sp.]MDP3453882.1 RHS repeat-associated core domain-containing protein [Methyloversatilis sp.]